MALTVTHNFVSAIADDPVSQAAGEVLPSHWNANHGVAGTLDAAQFPALTGAVTTPGGSLATSLGSFTKAQLDTAVSDGNVLYVGDVTQYTDELAQDAVGAMVDASLTYVDATPLLQRAALTGDVTASAGSNSTTIANDAVTNAKLANMATATVKGRGTAGTGDPEDLSVLAPLTISASGIDFDETATLGNNARVAVNKNSGATVGTRRRLNFIEGTNVTLTISDDAGNEEVDITITAAAGSGLTRGQTEAMRIGMVLY